MTRFDDPSQIERMLPLFGAFGTGSPTPTPAARLLFSTGVFECPEFRAMDRQAFRDLMSDDVTARRLGVRTVVRMLRIKAEAIGILEDSQRQGRPTAAPERT